MRRLQSEGVKELSDRAVPNARSGRFSPDARRGLDVRYLDHAPLRRTQMRYVM